MAGELIDLTELSDQQLLDLAASRPRVYKALTDSDPRVQLHERIYNANGTLKVNGKDLRFRDVIEEMGVAIAPDSNIARSRRHAASVINDDVVAIKRMRQELQDEKQTARYQGFRETLRARAQQLGYAPKDEDVDKIEAFMRDNEYGQKSADVAVEKFYETQETAVPNFESENTFTFGDEDSVYKKALLDSPLWSDTSSLTMAHAERVWTEMYGADRNGRRRNPMAR